MLRQIFPLKHFPHREKLEVYASRFLNYMSHSYRGIYRQFSCWVLLPNVGEREREKRQNETHWRHRNAKSILWAMMQRMKNEKNGKGESNYYMQQVRERERETLLNGKECWLTSLPASWLCFRTKLLMSPRFRLNWWSDINSLLFLYPKSTLSEQPRQSNSDEDHLCEFRLRLWIWQLKYHQ